MAQLDNRLAQAGGASRTGDIAIDAGLRAYMLRVYNYMGAGVALTGLVAMVLFSLATTADPSLAAIGAKGAPMAVKGKMFLTPLGAMLYASPLKYVLIFAPLAMCFFLGFGAARLSAGATQIAFWAFATLVGASMSTIFLVYAHNSIAQIFFVTAAAFGALSLWGYTTKRDLSGMGSFLIMGLFGLIAASLLNAFVFKSGVMGLAISAIGVLIFAGLMAYDTQRIKSMYAYVAGTDMVGKTVVMGALSLYLDFINMFQFLLSFMGSRD